MLALSFLTGRPPRWLAMLKLVNVKLEGVNVKGSPAFEAGEAIALLDKNAAYFAHVLWLGYDRETDKVQAVLDLFTYSSDHAMRDEGILAFEVIFAAFRPGKRGSVEIIAEENGNPPPEGNITYADYWIVVIPLD